jgi:aryl-alcohol dehydrogenase-like predicted oxidoreductase
MTPRRLGSTDLWLSPIGFGAFKIGRNEGTKYAEAYALPSEAAATELIHRAVAMGITLIDTAPAYGLGEERVGRALASLPPAARASVHLSTKVGEAFADGRSTYDFSAQATEASVRRSLERLGTNVLDLVFVHSNGDDQAILTEGSVTRTLRSLQERGLIRAIGFSGKHLEGHTLAIADGYDALMVEYHPLDASQRPVLEQAAERGVGVLIKKAMASGRIPANEAMPFALAAPAVTSVVVGSLRAENLAACVAAAEAAAKAAER